MSLKPSVTCILISGLSVLTCFLAPESAAEPRLSAHNPEGSRFVQPDFGYAAQDLQLAEPLKWPDLPSSLVTQAVDTEPVTEPSSSPPASRSGWALMPKVGTLGFGGDFVGRLAPNFNARIGAGGLISISGDVATDGIDYDGTLDVGGVPIIFDWLPLGKTLRLSAGLVINNNHLDVVSKPTDNQTIRVGNRTFNTDDVGRIDGDVDYNDVAPFIGLGLANPVGPDSRWRFTLDLGVMFQGKGDVTLSAPEATQVAQLLGLEAELEAEEEKIRETLTDFLTFYPVVQVGVSYQF